MSILSGCEAFLNFWIYVICASCSLYWWWLSSWIYCESNNGKIIVFPDIFFFFKRLRTLKINRVIKKLKFLNLKITEFLFSAFTSRKKCLKRPNYLGICDHVHVSVCVYVCVCAQHKKTSGGLSACLHRCPVSNWKLHFWIGFISNTAICHSGRYSTGRMSAALKKVSVAVLWNPSSIHS